MKRSLDIASRTPALWATFAATVALLVAFQALPIGGDLLDARPGYGYDEAMAALADYGEAGRRVYAIASPTLDTLLPLAYVAFMAGLIRRLRPTPRLGLLAWLPVAAGLLDLGENVQITAMLIQYPDVGPRQVASASLCTQLKTYALLLSTVAVVAFASAALWRRGVRRMQAGGRR